MKRKSLFFLIIILLATLMLLNLSGSKKLFANLNSKNISSITLYSFSPYETTNITKKDDINYVTNILSDLSVRNVKPSKQNSISYLYQLIIQQDDNSLITIKFNDSNININGATYSTKKEKLVELNDMFVHFKEVYK